VEEVPRLLAEREMSVRALEQTVGLSHGFLSRVLRQRDYKSPSPDLTRRVATALDLPPDFLPETRESFVCERVRRDPKLRERLYDQLRTR
jgi:transcriptional regulator with XRE-family HTH domain